MVSGFLFGIGWWTWFDAAVKDDVRAAAQGCVLRRMGLLGIVLTAVQHLMPTIHHHANGPAIQQEDTCC